MTWYVSFASQNRHLVEHYAVHSYSCVSVCLQTGAAFGRLLGEVTVYMYPQSIATMEILPGSYAVVGK